MNNEHADCLALPLVDRCEARFESIEHRECARCGELFSALDFRILADGRIHSWCRDCRAADARKTGATRRALLNAERADLPESALWVLAAKATGGVKYCPKGDHVVEVSRGRWYLRRYRPDALSGWCRACSLEDAANRRNA